MLGGRFQVLGGVANIGAFMLSAGSLGSLTVAVLGFRAPFFV